MATFFVTQAGTGDLSGNDPQNTMTLANFNANSSGGNTYYVIEIMGATIQPANSGGVGSPIIVRGDYPDSPGGTTVAGTGFSGGNDKNYYELRGLRLEATTAFAAAIVSRGTGFVIDDCDLISIFQAVLISAATGAAEISITNNRISSGVGGGDGDGVHWIGNPGPDHLTDLIVSGNRFLRGDGFGVLISARTPSGEGPWDIFDNDFTGYVGGAIGLNNGLTINVYNNFGDGNAEGIHVDVHAGASTGPRLINNTFINALGSGIVVNPTTVLPVLIRDNVLTGSVGVGIDDSGAVDSDYNDISGWATPYTTGSGAGAGFANDITDPPDLAANGYTQTTSPGYEQGEFVVGFHDTFPDQNGFTFKATPDMGLQSNLIAPETAPILAEILLSAPLDISQAQTLDLTDIGQGVTLDVVGPFQGQTLETPNITELGTIAVLDLDQAQSLGIATLTQAQNTDVDSLTQAQTLGEMLVFEDTDLGVLDSLTQAQSLLKPIISEVADLVTEDLSQSQVMGLAAMSQAQNLALEGIIQAQTLGRPTISDSTLPRLTPPTRRIKVAGGLRVISWGA